MGAVLARDVLPVAKRYQVQYFLLPANNISCVETNICQTEDILLGSRKYQGMKMFGFLQRNICARICKNIPCLQQKKTCVGKQISFTVANQQQGTKLCLLATNIGGNYFAIINNFLIITSIKMIAIFLIILIIIICTLAAED